MVRTSQLSYVASRAKEFYKFDGGTIEVTTYNKNIRVTLHMVMQARYSNKNYCVDYGAHEQIMVVLLETQYYFIIRGLFIKIEMPSRDYVTQKVPLAIFREKGTEWTAASKKLINNLVNLNAINPVPLILDEVLVKHNEYFVVFHEDAFTLEKNASHGGLGYGFLY